MLQRQEDKELYKSDVASAFRRIPIKPEHRQFANIMFVTSAGVLTAQHLTMMFGSIASVHGWNRAACLFRSIGRRLLHLPLLCYVDDYFGVDRKGDAEHAVECFARVLRACLGPDAAPVRKMGFGSPLGVLGVSIFIDSQGVTFWPLQEKVAAWLAAIDAFLAAGSMNGGQASKLAGQLAWAAQCAFRRLGRALLRPINDQIRARHSCLSEELVLALEWWREVLAMELCEKRAWRQENRRQASLWMLAVRRHTSQRCCSSTEKPSFAICQCRSRYWGVSGTVRMARLWAWRS